MQQNGALPEHKVVEKFKIAALVVFVNREKAVSNCMEVGIRNRVAGKPEITAHNQDWTPTSRKGLRVGGTLQDHSPPIPKPHKKNKYKEKP